MFSFYMTILSIKLLYYSIKLLGRDIFFLVNEIVKFSSLKKEFTFKSLMN